MSSSQFETNVEFKVEPVFKSNTIIKSVAELSTNHDCVISQYYEFHQNITLASRSLNPCSRKR